MAVLGRKTLITGLVLALAAFSGSLAGRLFLDVDEEDLYSLLPGVPAKDFFNPELGDAFAYDLDARRFIPTAICRLNVSAIERGTDSVRYRLSNDIGQSYNDVVKAANVAPESFFFKVLGVKEVSKEWVFERTFWQVSPQVRFDESCEQAVLAKAQDPRFFVYTVDSFEREGPDQQHIKLVRLSNSPIEVSSSQVPSNQSETGPEIPHLGWVAKIKRNWELVRFN